MPRYLLIGFLAIALGCQKDGLPLPLFEAARVPIADDITSVWLVDSLRGFATAGAPWVRGYILTTEDGGRTWRVDTQVVNRLERVMFDTNGVGYAIGLHGLALLRWPDDTVWRTFRTDYNWHRGAYFWSYRHGVLVSGEGFQGGILRKLGPEVWYVDTLHHFVNGLHDIWMTDSLTGCAVGLGWVLRTEDGGRTWQRQPPRGDFFCSVHFPTARVGYICGQGGALLRTEDGGRTWDWLRQGKGIGPNSRAFRALWFVSEQRGFLVGDGGLFWQTTDGGRSWEALRGLPASANATRIFACDGHGWIAAQGGRIFRFEY